MSTEWSTGLINGTNRDEALYLQLRKGPTPLAKQRTKALARAMEPNIIKDRDPRSKRRASGIVGRLRRHW